MSAASFKTEQVSPATLHSIACLQQIMQRKLPSNFANVMKAIVQKKYGSVDALEFTEIERPAVGDSDVLIRVHAAGLHVGDWHVMTGKPYLLRAIGFGLRAPKIRVRGIDVAGVVESVGRKVSEFRPGDSVFGTCNGAFAEFACASENNFALSPSNISLRQAAAVPTSAFAALQALRDRGEIRKGHKVLIIGATGGVGIFAVQIAKSFGALVTAVCRASKFDLARSLGADEVIDYKSRDFIDSETRYDVILDVGGNWPLRCLRRLLGPNGTLVLVGGEGGGRLLGGVSRWIHALAIGSIVGQKLRPLATAPNKTDLLFLKDLIASGRMMPVIEKTFELKNAPDAFRSLEMGNSRGKIVITAPV